MCSPLRRIPAIGTLSSGRIVKGAMGEPQGQTKGSILLIHEWWGLV